MESEPIWYFCMISTPQVLPRPPAPPPAGDLHHPPPAAWLPKDAKASGAQAKAEILPHEISSQLLVQQTLDLLNKKNSRKYCQENSRSLYNTKFWRLKYIVFYVCQPLCSRYMGKTPPSTRLAKTTQSSKWFRKSGKALYICSPFLFGGLTDWLTHTVRCPRCPTFL